MHIELTLLYQGKINFILWIAKETLWDFTLLFRRHDRYEI